MSFITMIATCVVLYLLASILWPLSRRARWWWLAAVALPLLLGALKLKVLNWFWPGGTFISPEGPRPVLIAAGFCYVLLVLTFAFIVLRDVFRLVLWLCSRRLSKRFEGRQVYLGLALYGLALLFSGISCYQALLVPEVREQEVVLSQLPEARRGFTVAVLADVHATSLNDEAYVEELVRRTMAVKPDLIVLPGDLIDGDVALRRSQVAPLARLSAPYGVYACMGNHEYYSGYLDWKAEIERLGIRVLVNESVVLAPGLTLAAVGDPSGDEGFPGQTYETPGVDFKAALAGVSGDVILLSHQPKVAAQLEPMLAAGDFPKVSNVLQISGHTHGGMMPVFDKLVIAGHNAGMLRGLYQRGPRLQVYVSSGAGIWPGFLMRLGIEGEISLLRLKGASYIRGLLISHSKN